MKLYKTVVWYRNKIIFTGETVAEDDRHARSRALKIARKKKPRCQEMTVTALLLSDPAQGQTG